MKKKTSVLSLIGLLIIIMVLGSCQKYEDGPFISFRTKKARLCNKWKETELLLEGSPLYFPEANNYIEFLTDGGFVDHRDDIFQDTTYYGTWEFGEHYETVITLIGSHSDTNNISRLMNDELWFYDNTSMGKLVVHYEPF